MFGAAGLALVLWAPPENFNSWNELAAVLARKSSVRLTVAVTPSQLTPQAAAVLKELSAKNRIETALRLDGDPLLPLLAEQRAQDITDRLAAARERYRVALGSAPMGFVPGAGALSPSTLPGLRALGFSWSAAGEYAGSTTAWAASGSLSLIPFRLPASYGAELAAGALDGTDASGVVVDEADGLAPAGALLRLLAAAPDGRAWSTSVEAAAAPRRPKRPAGSVRDWPSWLGASQPWLVDERAKRALALYAEAATALERYQNSGLADLKALENASEELYAAQAGRFYRALPPEEAPAADKEQRARLLAMYRKIKQSPPEALFTGAANTDGPTTETVRIAQGPGWVEFENPAGSTARLPDGISVQGPDPAGIFTPRSLRVDASQEGLALTARMGRLAPDEERRTPPAAAPEVGRLVLEIYIDVNGVAGAGATTLLGDKTAALRSKDAWEYAVRISATGAALFRANNLGAPILAAKLGLTADPKTGELRVAIPASELRGNPSRWGFVVAASAEGTGVLGLLAPLDQQKSPTRLSALRARPPVQAAGPSAPGRPRSPWGE